MLYGEYGALQKAFKEQQLHPGDLKAAVASSIASITAPLVLLFAAKDKQVGGGWRWVDGCMG